jgi:hypothetical protein
MQEHKTTQNNARLNTRQHITRRRKREMTQAEKSTQQNTTQTLDNQQLDRQHNSKTQHKDARQQRRHGWRWTNSSNTGF